MADIIGVADNIGDRVHIVDTSNPIVPFIAGELAGPGNPNYLNGVRRVALKGNFVFATSENDDSLTIINATVPAAPILAGVIRGPGAPNFLNRPSDIAVSGDFAFVTVETDNCLCAFNISDPTNPTFVSRLQDVRMDSPRALFVRGSYAYVLCWWSDSMTIVDISAPAAMSVVGSIAGAGAAPWLDSPSDVFVLGDYAYVVTDDEEFPGPTDVFFLQIINISNPAIPVLTGSLQSAPGNFLAQPRSIIVRGDYAYIASAQDDALTIINISNPAAPVYSGSLSGGGTPNYLNNAQGVTLIDDYAYVVCSSDRSIVEIDVTNPAAPVLVLAIEGAAVGWVFGIDYWSLSTSTPIVQTDPATEIT